MMEHNILELIAKRHSFYSINNNLPIEQSEVTKIIYEILRLYPSSFNAQETRIVLFYNKEHQKFWQRVEGELLKTAPADKTEAIKKRIGSFSLGAGTILYFIDTDVVKSQEQKMPLYAQNFKNWAIEGSAMLQYMVWTTLANYNIGASLQHYNPLINEMVKKCYNIPQNWELIGQMPFGGIATQPAPHQTENIESKIKIFS